MSTYETVILRELAKIAGRFEQELSVNKPFTELGVDSVVIVELSGVLSELLGENLSPTLLYDYPTIEELAAWLEARYSATSSYANAGKGEGPDMVGVLSSGG